MRREPVSPVESTAAPPAVAVVDAPARCSLRADRAAWLALPAQTREDPLGRRRLAPVTALDIQAGAGGCRTEALLVQGITRMAMTGWRAGFSQRSTASRRAAGSDTQPAVAEPFPTCRKMALPAPGIRVVL
jgi:hypothetical protein